MNTLLEYIFVFWSGVLVSFTPCVYPVIPITAGFIAGANTKGTKLAGFFVSLIYVLGLAITYCTLAVLASLTGNVFGQFQNSSVILFCVSGILIFFGLSMFEVIKLPTVGVNIMNKIKPRNKWMVLLLGMVSGLVIGPCAAPVLVTLLGYIASKQNMVRAVSLMFVFSYGVGTSLILVGTFSGLLGRLPRSGPWLIRIKQLCGSVLLIMGVWFLIRVVGI